MESAENTRGRSLVVFEGYDGSGKTTLMREAANGVLRGQEVVCIGR